MNALRTHQPAANCVLCGNGEPLPGATCAFEELCLPCQEGRCMDCGGENYTDHDYCAECLDGYYAEQFERHLDAVAEGGVR